MTKPTASPLIGLIRIMGSSNKPTDARKMVYIWLRLWAIMVEMVSTAPAGSGWFLVERLGYHNKGLVRVIAPDNDFWIEDPTSTALGVHPAERVIGRMDFYKLFGVFEDMEKISREHLRVRIGTFYDGGFKPGMISVENVGKMEIETTTEGISVMIKIGEILTLRISHFEYFFRPGVYPSEDIFYGVPHKWKLISNE